MTCISTSSGRIGSLTTFLAPGGASTSRAQESSFPRNAGRTSTGSCVNTGKRHGRRLNDSSVQGGAISSVAHSRKAAGPLQCLGRRQRQGGRRRRCKGDRDRQLVGGQSKRLRGWRAYSTRDGDRQSAPDRRRDQPAGDRRSGKRLWQRSRGGRRNHSPRDRCRSDRLQSGGQLSGERKAPPHRRSGGAHQASSAGGRSDGGLVFSA